MSKFVRDVDGNYIDMNYVVAIMAGGQVRTVDGNTYQLGKAVLDAVLEDIDRAAVEPVLPPRNDGEMTEK